MMLAFRFRFGFKINFIINDLRKLLISFVVNPLNIKTINLKKLLIRDR